MIPLDCLRLCLLGMWLVVGGVNCENTQRGYVLRVQTGRTPVEVRNDKSDYKRWNEPSSSRGPTGGFKTLSLYKGEDNHIYPGEEGHHSTDSQSAQIQSLNPSSIIPETQIGNIPKSPIVNQVNHFQSHLMSAPIIRGRNAVAYNLPESAFPDSKRIHHASNEAGFSTGAIQSPLSSSYQTKWTEGLSLAPVDFGSNRVKPLIYSSSSTRAKGPNIQDIIPSLNSVSHRANMKIVSPRQHSRLSQESHFPTRNWVSGYHTGSVFQSGSKPGNFEHNGFNDDSAKNSQSTDLNPVNMKADTIIEEHITSSNAEGVRGKHRSHPIWSRRDYGTDVTSDVMGYAQVGRLKPNFKAQHHSSSAPERKFLMPSFQSVRHNQDYGPHSRKLLFGRGGQAPRERQPNHKDTSNGTDKYSPRVLKSGKWRFQSTASPRSLVQGKFRPFQRVHLFGDSYTGRTRLSDAEMGPGYVAAITSSSHGLNLTSRDISSTVKPSVTAEMSTTSPSLTSMLTKSPHAELLPQTSVNLHEGQPRGEAGVAPLLEQNKMLLVTPPMPQPETDIEENGQDDTVVSPMEIEGSGVFTDPAAAAPVNISKSSENTSKR